MTASPPPGPSPAPPVPPPHPFLSSPSSRTGHALRAPGSQSLLLLPLLPLPPARPMLEMNPPPRSAHGKGRLLVVGLGCVCIDTIRQCTSSPRITNASPAHTGGRRHGGHVGQRRLQRPDQRPVHGEALHGRPHGRLREGGSGGGQRAGGGVESEDAFLHAPRGVGEAVEVVQPAVQEVPERF